MQDKSLIDGLLAKRVELQRESMDLRQRVAVLTNDLAALERVLEACGYRGTLSAAKPVQARMILFQRNEMRIYIMDVLRKADKPLTAREIAQAVCATEGRESADVKLLSSVTAKVGENLRKMKAARSVESEPIGNGNVHAWRASTK